MNPSDNWPGNLFHPPRAKASSAQNKKGFKNRQGFTLIEILVVTTVIGVLVSIATISGSSYTEKAKIARARSDIDRISKAITLLEMDTGLWPGHQAPRINTGSSNEVWDLTSCRAGLICTDGGFPNWKGPYLSSLTKDPWDMNYFLDTDYLVNGANRVVIGSFGPNKVGQNLYDSDDLIKIIL